jgi:hypothetical protein
MYNCARGRERRDKERKDRHNLMANLANEYGFETLTPKVIKCFDIAWDYGHSAGNEEVKSYFDDLVELIK